VQSTSGPDVREKGRRINLAEAIVPLPKAITNTEVEVFLDHALQSKG
jgi:hypothetical protein